MMKYLNKTKLVAAFGSAVLAVTLGAPANAAVVLGGADGWEVSYGGFVNLFYTQSDWDWDDGTNEDSAHLNEGLLPAFHTMTVKTPEINGLKGTAQITFAPDSSQDKRTRLNKPGLLGGDSTIDMREVFFNVEGDFGTISAGRTLSLFQRQAILKDYTLFGVGAMNTPDGSGTTLGRIGYGYVYPDFRTRFTYKTPNINGFDLEVGIFDPQEPLGAGANISETDSPQFQAEANYKSDFEGGNFHIWTSFLWQEQEIQLTGGGTDGAESFGWNIGIDLNMGGFNIMGSYYDGEALGTSLFNLGGAGDTGCSATACAESDNDGFIIQGAYTFNGITKVGVSFGESTETPAGGSKQTNDLWTVGVYHDVNSWLKVIAEYGQADGSTGISGGQEHDVFSIGGFLLW
jgi:hypothetical protein